jgi:hypothetical protein
MRFKFRAHHFLCAFAFEGKGYSPTFVKNFERIVKILKTNPDGHQMQVIEALDDICQPCPNHNHKQCASQALIQRLDAAHAEILQLKPEEELTWNQALKRLKKQMTLPRFHQACEPCQWKKLGICEARLIALQKVADASLQSF